MLMANSFVFIICIVVLVGITKILSVNMGILTKGSFKYSEIKRDTERIDLHYFPICGANKYPLDNEH